AYEVLSERGTLRAELARRLFHEARGPDELPAVGDWVALEPHAGAFTGTIQAVLPRRTQLARRAAGTRAEVQVLAANVDLLLVATSLNHDLSERRLDRYLALARSAGVEAAVVLTKADLASELPDLPRLGARVFVTSAVQGTGIDELRSVLSPGLTVALLGSSGAGKSSLVNALLGAERQAVLPIDENDRGRHTTTRRELLLVPTGGLVIDTPGLRELQLLEGSVEDVELLASRCRFGDCAHETEPGCAVREAIAAGELDPSRLESWQKIAASRRREAWKEKRRERSLAAREKRRDRHGSWRAWDDDV
ncbi:MAG TPA: ribosome small subunit-dependent GTPase A, partial [Planctomycetota bacterium]|nr:ribosome small subunit-dependent GTPase A [Planctomycetota bacterium]